MWVKGSRMLRSALCLLLAFLLTMGTCITAFATEADDTLVEDAGAEEAPEDSIKYVSLGDSMSNGYGLDGYYYNTDEGKNVNVWGFLQAAPAAYPTIVAKTMGWDLTQLALSGFRAEEVYYLLTYGTENAYPGDDYTHRAGLQRFDDRDIYEWFPDYAGIENMAKLFQDSVAEADVVSMQIATNNFGTFLTQRLCYLLSQMTGFSFGGSYYDTNMQAQLNAVAPEFAEQGMVVYNDLMNLFQEQLAAYGISNEGLTYFCESMTEAAVYSLVGFMHCYKGIVDYIATNSDAEIILVAMPNSLDGMKVSLPTNGDGEAVIIDMGEYFSYLTEAANMFMAGLPAAYELEAQLNPENAKDVKVYFADPGSIELIISQMGTGVFSGYSIVEERIVSNITGTVFPLLKEAIDSMVGQYGLALVNVSKQNVADYEAFAERWARYVNAQDESVTEEPTTELTSNQILSCAICVAIRDAIVESAKLETIDANSIMALAGNGLDDVFADIQSALNPKEIVNMTAVSVAVMAEVQANPAIMASLTTSLQANTTFMASVTTHSGNIQNAINSLRTNPTDADAQAVLARYGLTDISSLTEEKIASAAFNAAIADNPTVVFNAVLANEKAMAVVAKYASRYAAAGLTTALGTALKGNNTIMGLFHLFARYMVGDGVGCHPSAKGYATTAAAIIEAYKNNYTATDETISNLNEAYKIAYQKAVDGGYVETVKGYLATARTALGTAQTAVTAFEVPGELENTKALLLTELDNTAATIAQIESLLDSEELYDMWDDYLALKDQLDAHMTTIQALAAEIEIVITPYVNAVVDAYNYYCALINKICVEAYVWLEENSEAFAEEYAAWVEAVAAAAGEIDPRLEEPIRAYLTDTPAKALSILYAYGSEAWSKLMLDSAALYGSVADVLAILENTLSEYKDEILEIIESNEQVLLLREDIEDLRTQLEGIYNEMLQAPISTALGYEEIINGLKTELGELYGRMIDAVLSASKAVSPELYGALEAGREALVNALKVTGMVGSEYASWLGGHAGEMANALMIMLMENTELLGSLTLPVIGELIADFGNELWGYGTEVYEQVYAFITVCVPNWLKAVSDEAIEAADAFWKDVILPEIHAFLTWLTQTEEGITAALNGLYSALVTYKDAIDEAVAQIESDIRNEIARIEAELEELYGQLADASGAAREEILAKIAALENELAIKQQELADAVMTALAQINAELPGIIKNAYNAFVDAVYEWARETAPEVADYIYDYLYNNPAEVIGFFREYGDDAVAFVRDNIEVFAAVIGFVAYTFGDDIADYVMNNPEEVLAVMIGWYKEHGENAWELIKVYLDELGIIDAIVDTVTDPEQMKLVFAELLAILEEYGPEMAQKAWDYALEQGYVAAAQKAVDDLLAKAKADLEAWLEDPEGFVSSAAAELQAKLDCLKEALSACQNELTNEVLAQIAALEAQLNSLYEQLQTATGEVKAQIEAAIAVIEAAIEALEAEAAALEAEIEAICAQMADIEAKLAELAEKTMAVGEKLAALVEQAEAMKTILETLAAEGLESLEDNIDAVINTISSGVETIVALAGEVQDAIAAAKELADSIATTVNSVIAAVDARIEGFAEAVEAIGATLEAGLAPILDALNAIANAAGELSEEAKAKIAELEEEITAVLAAANETAAAIRAEYAEAIAALEQAVADAEAALAAKKAELESAISAELAARKAELEAQIADLTAQLEAKKAELESAAEDAKADIEAAIEEIEAALAEARAALAEVEAQIQAAVAEINAAIAALETAYAEAKAALDAKIAEVEAAVAAALAEANAKAAELQARIDALIAEANAQIDTAMKEAAAAVEAVLEAVKDNVMTAIGHVVDAAMDAAEAIAADAVAKVIEAATALGALVEEKILAVGEVVAGYVDEFVAALEEAYEKATTGEYEITETNYYVALGDGSAVSESYVDLLAAELELGEAYVNLAEDGMLPEELLAELAAGNMDYISEIAKADLITVGFSPATFANEQIERFISYEDMVEMDWTSLVGEAGLPYVEDAIAELDAYLLETGIEDEFLLGTISTIVESYAYSVVSFGANYAVLVDAIHEISPNAEVIIIGSYNAFNDVEFVFGDSALPMGEYMEKLTDLVNAYMVAYALIAENTTYVDVTETETELTFEGQMEIDPTDASFVWKLGGMLKNFGDTIIPTEDGHEYIKNQILDVETIVEPDEPDEPTGMKGDANGDGIVDSWDAAVVLEYDAGLNPEIDLSVSDVDGNGIVDSWDASLILEYDAGLRSSFPVEE